MSRDVTSTAPDIRAPLEYARCLDDICASMRSDVPLGVATTRPALLQAVVNRHDHVLPMEDLMDQILVPNTGRVEVVSRRNRPAETVDRTLVLEPANPKEIRDVVETFGRDCRYDVIVGNPYSFNRIEDRTVSSIWCSPLRAQRIFTESGFDVSMVGYHGPRSIVQSAVGRVWQAMGRPDKRDVYTHRMRAAYREASRPLTLLSCLVHIRAEPKHR